MKILYVGELGAGTSCLYRKLALERLGHQVVGFDPAPYRLENRLLRPIAFRLAISPHAYRFNHDILAMAESEKPDIFWADKQLLLTPRTLDRLRALGITSVSYMIDNAFGPRRDPGWRMYTKCIPYFDLHVTQRDVSLGHYRERGARDVMKIQTAYEPTIHFPPPEPLSDEDRIREVSFIGTPYDDRGEILKELSKAGLPVIVSGSPTHWNRALGEEVYAKIFRFGELYERDYRETIWRSKINLSFLTKANQDEYTHKSFEIAACGGFLLAERSPGHEAKFVEGVEAAFFTGTADLITKIQQYLPDEAARTHIAAAGRERAVRDGYGNDTQVGLIVERLKAIRGGQTRS
jgi:hypothetical protein